MPFALLGLQSCQRDMLPLSQMVAFLAVITFACRMSELVALSSEQLFLVLHNDKICSSPLSVLLA